MNKTLWMFLTFLGTATLQHRNTAKAADLGTHGHTFEIIEPDLLKQIEGKLQTLAKNGELSKHNDILMEKAKKALDFPEPVKGMTRLAPESHRGATKERVFYYDPSITVPYDLKDHEGKVFHKVGTRINPLKFKSLSAPLVFIDGNDQEQIAWVETTYLKLPNDSNIHKFPKIILTSGSPFQLMERWDQPIYFDQGGRLTKKLGIKHGPAVINQEGLKLKITEIALEDLK